MTDAAATPTPSITPSPRFELMLGGAVIVAHRAGVLSRVDRLLVMKDGAVQSEGPREDVLARLREGAQRKTQKATGQ